MERSSTCRRLVASRKQLLQRRQRTLRLRTTQRENSSKYSNRTRRLRHSSPKFNRGNFLATRALAKYSIDESQKKFAKWKENLATFTVGVELRGSRRDAVTSLHRKENAITALIKVLYAGKGVSGSNGIMDLLIFQHRMRSARLIGGSWTKEKKILKNRARVVITYITVRCRFGMKIYRLL